MIFSNRKLPLIVAITLFFQVLSPEAVQASKSGAKALLHKATTNSVVRNSVEDSLLQSSTNNVDHRSSNGKTDDANNKVGLNSQQYTRRNEEETDDILQSDGNATDATDSDRARGLTDLVELVPFDVRIALTANDGIQIFEVSNIVTSWMNDVFSRHLKDYGFTYNNGYATFQAVVLLKRQDRYLRKVNVPKLRMTQTEDNADSNGSLSTSRSNSSQRVGDSYIAKFKGGAYFVRKEKDSMSVPEHDVLVIQQMAFYNTTLLLEKLQLSTAIGLGSAVVDVRVFLNTNSDDSGSDSTNNSSSNGTDASSNANTNSTKQLETVIIAAIAVAVMAFLFLLAAIYWAYRYDKKNRDAYLVNNTAAAAAASAESKKKNAVDRTESETTSPKTLTEHPRPPVKPIYQARYPAYPTEIVAGPGSPNYPESVISDSIIDDQRSIRSFAGFGNTTGHDNTDEEAEEVIDIKSQLSVDLQTNSVPPLDDEVSASLSQYYRSGMGKVGTPISQQSAANGNVNRVINHHNDAASVSSMESYGYSLDGTIPTIMSPNNTNSRSGGGASNVLGNNLQSNPYMSHLERIGGLPVEPDLRHIENLNIEDIDVGSTSDDDTNTKGEGTIGAENDLCTIDGSMTIPFK